jgi:hypothetical protein
MFEPSIELRIVAPILDHPAGMGDSGPIAREQGADLGKGQPADNVREIHRDLPRKGSARRPSQTATKSVEIDLEHRRDQGIDRLLERPVATMIARVWPPRRRSRSPSRFAEMFAPKRAHRPSTPLDFVLGLYSYHTRKERG